MQHEEGTFKGSGGAEMYYQAWLAEEPRAVLVIIHGLGEHSGRYGRVVDCLVPQGYSIFAMDNRGHGHSPGPKGHIDKWDTLRQDTRAFFNFAERRADGRPLFLMGHSLGGCIVLDYVLHYPNGLTAVVVSSPAINQDDVPGVLAFLSRVMVKVKPNLSVSTGLDANAISRDPAVVTAYTSDPLVHDKGTPGATVAFMETAEWIMDHAAEFQPPLLITHGDADTIVDLKSTLNFYEQVKQPDKKLILYEGSYHEPHNDLDYKKVVANIEKWLTRHLA